MGSRLDRESLRQALRESLTELVGEPLRKEREEKGGVGKRGKMRKA